MSGLEFSIKGLEEQQRRLRDERRGRVGVAVAVIASLFALAGHERSVEDEPGVGGQPGLVGPATPLNTPPQTALPVARLAANPTRLDFGVQQVGTGSQERTVTLTNIGTKGFTADYSVVNDSQHFVVTGCHLNAYKLGADGGSCELSVAFRPGAAGQRKARVAVFEVNESKDRVGAALVTIDLTGQGRPPPVRPAVSPPEPARLEVIPTQLDFSSPRPARQDVVARNGGAGAVSISDASLSGQDAGAFRLDTNDCSEQPLAAGEQCTITVIRRFFAAASLTAELRLEHTAANSPARVELRRTSAPVATVQAEPDSLDFGSVLLRARSTRSVTMTNVGAVEARNVVTAFIGNSDSFQLGRNDCRGTLAPQARCTVEVVFAPAKAGLLQSGLMIAGTIVLVRGTGEAEGDPPPPQQPANVIR